MKKPIIALILICIMTTPGCFSSEVDLDDNLHGDPIEKSKRANDFDLITSDNQSYNFAQETAGKVVIIAFLFTNCYDICPVVTYNLGTIHESLNQSEIDSIEFLTITVDPWRDNTTVLNEWKQATTSNWTHLTINNLDEDSQELQELNNVWTNFDVGLQIEENASNDSSGIHHTGDYNIDHSTGTIIIDHLGYQRVWWGDYDWIVDLVKEDLLYLVSQIDEK